MNPRILLRGILLIGSLVAFGYLLEVTDLGSHLDKAWIDSEVRGKGLNGALLFVAVGTLFTGVGLPRQLIGFLGGYAFGFLWGTLFSLAAATLGCIAAFFYARWLGRSLIKARFPERIRRLDQFISGNPFSMTLLIRLLPVGSNLATNLAAGVTRVSPLAFFLGSALGYIPQNAVFALAGSGINLDPVFRIGLATALFVISALLGVYLYRRFRHGRSFDRAVDQELGEPSVSDGAPGT
jgi:uncharacterized membrane protein YdjX (TVP38/TMEM64 family)